MCVQVYHWDCLYVCCSQTGALAHTRNQVAGLIACVCKYTVGTAFMYAAAKRCACHTHNQVAGLIACVRTAG